MFWMMSCGVAVAEGGMVVAVPAAGVVVAVAEGAGVTGVTVGDVEVGVIEVGEAGTVVKVGNGVKEGRGVGEEMGVEVGVMNIGEPNSLHPRSGAPVNPVSGAGGMGSPLFATN